ncbi:SulP family inorganic anion transporter [Lysobacter enzymogenes]|uniref:SulP family inorganic anion transporter n=1 Tax=Lysobacter enzymogenes TaxID=69 RepID=UPI001A96751C|nr:SulP family inorganic anion transporter [Lysobacter enzymogenes]QQP94938.1 SulP family inorganic anion transporter [Lysobacter enzymogenes]
MSAPAPAGAASAGRGADVVAGLAIAGLLLPEAVAYSALAGLPAQTGVFALFAGLLAYGLIGRSRFAIVSATSSSAAVLAAATLAVAGPDPAARAAIAGFLTLATGACFLAASAARLGGLSQMIARPVLRGFTFGLACVIVLKQLPSLLGLHARAGDFAPLLLELPQRWREWQPASFATGALALLALKFGERFPKLPASLLVIALGVAASSALAAHGVALTGAIALSPPLGAPGWPGPDQWLTCLELALALTLVLYAESYTAIRAYALKHGDAVEPNRDLFALGVANAVSGLLHGLPVGAGYSATSANEAAGARSRVAGLVAALAVLLMVAFALAWIERIPQPVLAAIVIHAVGKSLRPATFAPYLRWHRDRLVAFAAVATVLSLGILDGLLAAIAFSLLMLLRRLSRPRLSVLGRLPGSHDFVDTALHPQAQPVPGVLVLRPEQPLFFANAEPILALARQQVEARPQARRLVLSLEISPDLDSTSLEALSDFDGWLRARGVALTLARLKDGVRTLLERVQLPGQTASALEYWSVDDAVNAGMEANEAGSVEADAVDAVATRAGPADAAPRT